ncbi:LLM class flavin-dependent oxidoreductase [Cupriavidus basilensis]
MLPNHSPLVVAEQFGTLASLFPGRIDLGLGRAPGTDQSTARAAPQRHAGHGRCFPGETWRSCRPTSANPRPGQRPAGGARRGPEGAAVAARVEPVQRAAVGGDGPAFCLCFALAPGFMRQAIDLYRQTFRPSAQLSKPHVMLGLNVFAADSDAQARRVHVAAAAVPGAGAAAARARSASGGQYRIAVDGDRGRHIRRSLACSVVGDPEGVRTGLRNFIEEFRPDELMLTAQIHDHEAPALVRDRGAGHAGGGAGGQGRNLNGGLIARRTPPQTAQAAGAGAALAAA